MPPLLLLVHAAATWFMVGLIWFVQVVHYPLFAAVGDDALRSYGSRNQRRTSWVVGPVMIVELVTALLLLVSRPASVSPALAWAGAVLLALVWISTAAVQVPLHEALARDPAPRLIARLVATNWLRTFAWSARGLLALAMLARGPS